MTEAAKFTPGPWTYPGRTFVTPASSVGTVHQNIGRGESIAHVTGENAEANARLIAAAPDLLDALKKSAEGWANAIELGLIPAQHVTSATILRDEARAAIAKATA